MTNKNLFASALFLILPFVGFSIYRFTGFWRIASVVVLTLSFLCIFFARSRTVWAAIISALLFVSLVWALKNRKTAFRILCKRIDLKKCAIFFAAGLVIISISVVAYHHRESKPFPSAGEYIKDPIQENSVVESISSLNSLNERVWLWKNTIAMVKENPLLGVGLGQWRLAFPAYGMKQNLAGLGDGSVEIVFLRPHNDFIWVLSESGGIGLLFYLSIYAISIFYAMKIYFLSDKGEKKMMAMVMLFGIIGYMIISFFSFPKERIVHNILLMLILACLVSSYHRSFPGKIRSGRPTVVFVNIFTLVLLAFCMTVGYIRLDSETHVKEALAARRAGNWQKVLSEIDAADSLFYQIDPVSIPLAWYRGIANYSIGKYAEAHRDFKRAYQIHPNHIHVLNNLGTSCAQLGDYENAVVYYKKALDVCPEFAEARINLGVLYLHTGNFYEAGRYLMPLDHDDQQTHASTYWELVQPKDKGI
jgi:tetratricopeptide (TPR) repeat protein